jgi:hypothetical protein
MQQQICTDGKPFCTNPLFQSPLNTSAKDKFLLVMTLPQVLRKMSKQDPDLDVDYLQATVHGTIVPDSIVSPIELRFGGQGTNWSSYSRPSYPPLTVNFIIDNDFKNYYILWKWLSILNDPINSSYSAPPSNRMDIAESGRNAEYQTNLSILALNEYNDVIMEFMYMNCFITSLKGISYSYRDSQLNETTADFHFGQLNMYRPKKYPKK